MRAITVQQPWTWAIIHGGKTIENRTQLGTWLPARESRIAIQAGTRWPKRAAESPLVKAAWWSEHNSCDDGEPIPAQPLPRWLLDEDEDFGVIIGTVLVEDVHLADSCCHPWGESEPGKVHLVLAGPRACDPIPFRGNLGLLTLPDNIAEQLA
ncbi:MAG: hypothetical protein ABI418_16410 [Jatrophihabitantaceae bacterium]